MNPTRLIIAIVVLAGLGGVIYWSNQQEAAKESDAPPKILAVAEPEISGIRVERNGEAPTVLAREDQTWVITEPDRLSADQSKVATLTSAASALASNRIVDEDIGASGVELSEYGLDPADILVTFTMKDGSTHRVRLGDDTTDGTGSFAMVDDDPRLYTVDAARKAPFDKGTMDLRERHLLTFDPGKLTGMELARPEQPAIHFVQRESRWSIDRPETMRADVTVVLNLISALSGVEISEGHDAEAAMQNFNRGKAWAKATLEGPEQLTLEVKESGGQYYARSSQVPGVYLVGAGVGPGLEKTLEDFRNRKLFDFGFETPERIEYTTDGKARTFEKQGERWVENGRTLDSLAIQNAIGKLRDLEASSFDDVSFGDTDLEITVEARPAGSGPDAEAVSETVRFSERETDYLAVRSAGDGIYQLEKGDIASLRQALAAVREAIE